MDFTIRPASIEDAASMVDVLNAIIRAGAYTIMDEPVTVADQVEFVRGFPAAGVFNVAACAGSGRVLALQDVQPLTSGVPALRHVGEISTFVALDQRRRGIGRCLTDVTIRDAHALGFRKLRATIRADNLDALSFYRSRGFETIGTARRHALVRGTYVDEVISALCTTSTTRSTSL
ncbi:MAG: GNAT family N-acetyltransferase [Planctomycetota bacterium]|jgi:L-amino acid N-acyltransferase YncA